MAEVSGAREASASQNQQPELVDGVDLELALSREDEGRVSFVEPVKCPGEAKVETEKKIEPKAPQRLHVMDNAKFFLTMFVVGEHTLIAFESERWFSSIFRSTSLVYLMPTYIFISGYTSSTDLTTRKIDGILKVAAIYVMAQLLNLLLLRYGSQWLETTKYGETWKSTGGQLTTDKGGCQTCWKFQDWLVPIWMLWYLLYLVVWRLALPFWWRLRWPLVSSWVFGAVFCCFKLFRYMGNGDEWSEVWILPMDSIFAWFPLFVLGAVAKDRKWALWDHKWSRLAGLAVVLSFCWIPAVQTIYSRGEFSPFGICPQTIGGIQGEMWHYQYQMDSISDVVGDGFGGRLAKTGLRMLANLVQAICVWGIIHVMPRSEWKIMTSFGSRSLANYIFHPLSGMLMSYIGVYGPNRPDGTPPWWGEIVVIIMIVPTSLFWMSPWVWKFVKPVVDPPIHWILRPAAPAVDKAPASKPAKEIESAASTRAPTRASTAVGSSPTRTRASSMNTLGEAEDGALTSTSIPRLLGGAVRDDGFPQPAKN